MTVHQLENAAGLPLTSSCGRLFDAFSSLSGVCLETRYEGQPAILFEQYCDRSSGERGYEFPLDTDGTMGWISWAEAVRRAVQDLGDGCGAGRVSTRFHFGLSDALSLAAVTAARERDCRRVVLSGGCFMNRVLLERMTSSLSKAGLTVVTHERVPCNDGGISLGQAVIAAAHLNE